jgi:hypothetical protein
MIRKDLFFLEHQELQDIGGNGPMWVRELPGDLLRIGRIE